MNDRQHAGMLLEQNTRSGLNWMCFFSPTNFSVSEKIYVSPIEQHPMEDWASSVPSKASPVWLAMLPNSLCYRLQDPEQPLLPPTNSRHQAMRPTLHLHICTYIPISRSPWAAPSYGCVSQQSHTSTLVADARANLIFNSMRLLS